MSNEVSYLQLDKLNCYKIAYNLSNYIWDIVLEWDYFSKDTIGKQYVRSADSISANIAEGFGRYFKKDKINFYRYAYGSLKEIVDWTNKAKYRQLITEQQYTHIDKECSILPKEINALIKYTNLKLKI